MLDSRETGPGMQYGSAFPGLFSSGGTDPRDYCGPPNPRRCATPLSATRSQHTPNRSISATPSNSPSRQLQNGMAFGVENGQLSLLNFNPEMDEACQNQTILLDSPRSVTACLRLGLIPTDFIVVTFEKMLDEMIANDDDSSDPVVCKMRYNYLCRRAKQKLKLAIDERSTVLLEETAGHKADASGTGNEKQSSSKIQEEEKRLQKIVANNKSRLWQQLLHAELMQKKREREDERIMAARSADDQQRKARVRELIEKSRKDEEAQALRNEARDLERREHQARSELKRALYEAKDKQVKDRIHQQQLEAEAENEAKRQLNLERREQMKQQSIQLLREKRVAYEERNEIFLRSQEEFQHKMEVKNEERASLGKVKRIKIKEAIDRSNEQLAAKIHKTVTKERLAEELQAQNAAREKQEMEKKAEVDKEMAEQRRLVLLESYEREKRRVEELVQSMSSAELKMKRVADEREAQRRIRKEVQEQKEMDKRDCVARSKRMESHRIEELMESQEEKRARIDKMYAQQEELKRKRKEHREEAERSRVKIEISTPGPQDFVPMNDSISFNTQPKWKFGLPACTMGLRVIDRSIPAPAYAPSPGPCVYRYETCEDARHRRTAAFSLSKHDRWASQSDVQVTPGPQDYAPTSPEVHGRCSSSTL